MRRAVLWLHLRPWLSQPLRSLLVVVAVAAGVTLCLAVVIQYRSLQVSIARTGGELAATTPLRVVGPTDGSLTPEVVRAAGSVPGTDEVVPMVQAVTTVVSEAGGRWPVMAVGIDCSVTALAGPVGCVPDAPDVPDGSAPPAPGTVAAVSPTVAGLVGPGGVIRTNAGPVPVDDLAVLDALDDVGGGRLVAFPRDDARALFSRPADDVAYVTLEPGATVDGVRAALASAVGPGVDVLDTADRPMLMHEATTLLPQLVLIGLITAVVGALLVYGVMSLMLAERRRELAVGAALGWPRSRLLRGALVEAGSLGVCGGLVGVGAATLVADRILQASAPLAGRHGVTLGVHVDAPVVALGVAAGVALAVAAAAGPAWRAGRPGIAGELYDRSTTEVESRRRSGRGWLVAAMGLVALGACLASGWRGAIYTWQPPAGHAGVLLVTGAFLGLCVTAGPAVLRRVRRLTDPLSGVAGLAGTNLGAAARRNGGMLVAVAATVALGGFLASLVSSIEAMSARYTYRSVGDRVVVSLSDLDHLGDDLRLDEGFRGELAAVGGVARVDRVTWVGVGRRPGERFELMADEASPLGLPVRLGRARQHDLDRGEVLVGTGLARARGLHEGSTFEVPTPEGTRGLRVAGVWSDPGASGFRATVSVATLAELYGVQAYRQLAVTPAPGTGLDELARRITEADLAPGLRVWTPEQYAGELTAAVSRQLRPFVVLQRALVGVVLVSTSATLLLVGVTRMRELAVIGAIGLGPARLFRMSLVEAGLLGAVGCAFGLASSVAVTVAVRSTVPYLYGALPPLRFSVLDALLVAALTLVTTVAGAVIPAWRTSRMPPADALRCE